jgi:hypothetical protein
MNEPIIAPTAVPAAAPPTLPTEPIPAPATAVPQRHASHSSCETILAHPVSNEIMSNATSDLNCFIVATSSCDLLIIDTQPLSVNYTQYKTIFT